MIMLKFREWLKAKKIAIGCAFLDWYVARFKVTNFGIILLVILAGLVYYKCTALHPFSVWWILLYFMVASCLFLASLLLAVVLHVLMFSQLGRTKKSIGKPFKLPVSKVVK